MADATEEMMLTRREMLKWAAAGTAVAPLVACRAEEAAQVLAPAPAVPSAAAPVLAAPDPTIGVRRSAERGIIDHGWLKARHTFAFARYNNPEWRHFRHLRVINEDTIQAGQGFPLHPHRDMEILTYVLSGSLEHKDTLGNGGVIEPGLVQYMSAGVGIKHSEYNPSAKADTHLLQIWLTPARAGYTPRYESRHFGDERHGGLRLLASADGREGSIQIGQQADLYAAVLRASTEVLHGLGAGRAMWLQVARGSLELNGHTLYQGDGAFSLEATGLEIRALEDCELLLFEMG